MEFVAAVLVAVVLAALATSALGLSIGWRRAMVVGLVGTFVFAATASLFDPERDPGLLILAVMTAAAVLAAMGTAAVLELLVPYRPSSRPRGPRNPLRALRDHAERVRRSLEVSRIVVRRGLSTWSDDPDGDRFGRALALALQEAGGVFVKLGQVLSTRPDLVSPPVASRLAALQQQVAPVSFDEVVAVITAELGAHPDQVFLRFERRSAASASIAQVHRATTRDGREVAVKVQRPAVARQIRRDLDILDRLVRRLERRQAWARNLRLSATVAGMAAALEEELDFRLEAGNGNQLRRAIEHHERIHVPEADLTLTTRRVLVSEWMDGDGVQGAGDRTDPRRAADDLLRCHLEQLLVIGRFHADPHPGNVLLRQDGGIVLLDFGSVGFLDRRQTGALRSMLMAVDRQDAAALVEALRSVATGADDVNVLDLERAIGQVLTSHFRHDSAGGSGQLPALLGLVREFGLAVDPVVAGAFRAVVTLDGTLRVLAPGFDVLGAARRHARALLAPTARLGELPNAAEEQVTALLPVLAELPRHADRLGRQLARGELSVRLRPFADAGDRAFLHACLAELQVTAIAIALTVTGALLLARAPLAGATLWLGVGLAVPGAVLTLRNLSQALRRSRHGH